ncbi:fimbrial protein [Enterobacter sp.]|uniref:fimbrial protein n=1 Tax=Enterobacter sp. TaxID=42895 RepID=UPI0029817E1F|nr:fimbrial protein [Enterobacter sp.]
MRGLTCVLAALSLLAATPALAGKEEKTIGVDSIDIYYTANVIMPTCTVVIEGPQIIDNGGDKYTLTLGNAQGETTLNAIKSGLAKSDFKLILRDDARQQCSSNLNDVGITLTTPNTLNSAGELVLNRINDSSGAANIAVGFYLRDDASKTWLKFNTQPDTFRYSLTEISNGVWLTAQLAETAANQGGKGKFAAQVVFNFDYR